MAMQTEFAPAERAGDHEVKRQYRLLAAAPLVREFLDSLPNMVLVLNRQRQIVFANDAFWSFVAVDDEMAASQGPCHKESLGCFTLSYLGLRPGEAFRCVRSSLSEGGCGTTLFCRACGTVQSILNSQEKGALDEQECRMTCGQQKVSLDLRVWSRPISIDSETFTVFSVVDISDEKRRAVLERIFFHDVLNTVSGVKGLADLLVEAGLSESETRDVAGMLSESAQQLVEEISAQRMLSAAERGDLKVSTEPICSLELMFQIVRQFHSADCAAGKILKVSELAEHIEFVSDPLLIRRVLINLTKNALEAVGAGSCVSLNSFVKDGAVCFSVHNDIVMPPEVQRQLFSRSFSTKGAGRGLGTYSIKLISEKYLNGLVSFVSNEERGTIFTVCYPRTIPADGGQKNKASGA